MVTPDHAAFAVDRADAVAVAVERDAEVEILLGNERAQVRQIRFDRGIGMMIGKVAVDISVEEVMLPREAGGERFQRRARGAVTGIPADAQPLDRCRFHTAKAREQPLDVLVQDRALLDRPGPVAPGAFGGDAAEPLDVLPEERPALKYHLEAVVVGGIVAAGYLNAAVHLFG